MATRRHTGRWSWTALMVCLVVASGCAGWRLPEIDPTGEHIFVPSSTPSTLGYRNVPNPVFGPQEAGVTLSPRRMIAPVGSEVVMLAGVVGADNYLTTNARVQWMIAPGGVGHFVNIDQSHWVNCLVLDFTKPRKITETYAIGTTSRKYLRLTRGTTAPQDDVYVLRGQTWITVSSPVEGTSYVTVYSPDVQSWQARKQSSTIHWVDASWVFPPPSINPAGTRHVFTTTLTRQTNQAPLPGWLVRYEILDGPPAGFAPEGATVAEVATDDLGQASVEVFQNQPTAGTNRIGIQVIRPETLGGPRFVVGSGATMKTWSAPQICLRKSGPSAGTVGATLTYCIELTNPGDQPADRVMVTDEVPVGWDYLSSNPPAALTNRSLQWNVGPLPAATARRFEVNLRPGGPGTATACAAAVAAGGLQARDCVTTTVSAAIVPGAAAPVAPAAAARLDVQVLGPDRATIGQTVKYEIRVTNVGNAPATGLVLRDEFSPGLKHAAGPVPIERSLGVDLAPGQSTQGIGVEFRVAQAGSLCQTVTVTGNGGIQASKQVCVTALAPAQQQQGPEKPSTEPPASGLPTTAQKGKVEIRIAAPTKPQTVGDLSEFSLVIENPGTVELSDVELAVELDAVLDPQRAPRGFQRTDNGFAWTLKSLAAGSMSEILAIECRCKQASPQACVRARARAADGAEAKGEACVEIRAPKVLGGSLDVKMTDLREPVAVGKEETYEIRVTNIAESADHDVLVKVALPAEMTLNRLKTTGPGGGFEKVEDETVQFKTIAQLLPGQTLAYRVVALATKAGAVRATATVSSKSVKLVTCSEETEIFAEKP